MGGLGCYFYSRNETKKDIIAEEKNKLLKLGKLTDVAKKTSLKIKIKPNLDNFKEKEKDA